MKATRCAKGLRRGLAWLVSLALLLALVLAALGIVAVPMASPVQAEEEVTLITADFESGLPEGWDVENLGGACFWDCDNPWARPGFDGCSGVFMMADSENCGFGEDMDTALVTPPIDCSAYSTVLLEFDHHFEYSTAGEAEMGDVDVWDGTTWQNKAQYRDGGFGGDVTIDISDVAAGSSGVKIRWHYYNAIDAFYWQVDNVEVSGSDSPPIPDEEVPIYAADFEDGLPAEWEVVGDETWQDDNPAGRLPEGGCDGEFMIADCAACPPDTPMDAELVTPAIDCSGYSTVMLEFDHYFCYCPDSGEEKADVDIWDGTVWVPALRYERSAAAGHVAKEISDVAAGKSAVKIRWHYYDAYNDLYWEVDNFSLSGAPAAPPPPPPPVGGEAYPVNKLAILAPWLAAALFLAGGVGWLTLRRRRPQG